MMKVMYLHLRSDAVRNAGNIFFSYIVIWRLGIVFHTFEFSKIRKPKIPQPLNNVSRKYNLATGSATNRFLFAREKSILYLVRVLVLNGVALLQ